MTEINVIKVETQTRVLTREEREVIYQDIASKLNLPYFYFENIINLEDETNAYDAAHIKPVFTVLLLRKLIEFNNVIPIIQNLKKGVSDPLALAKLYGTQQVFQGGADVKYFGVTLQTMQAVKAVTTINLENYLAAQEKDKYKFTNMVTEMEVCGFIITDKNSVVYNEGFINTISRMKSGSYYDKYLWDTIFDTYFNITEKKIYKNARDFLIPAGNYYYFLFKDEESAKHQASILFGSLIHRDSYKDYARQYLHLCAELEPDKKLNKLTNHIIEKFKIFEPESENIKSVEKNIKKSAIQQYLEELEKEKLIIGKIGFQYNNSAWFDLMARQMGIVMEKLIFIHSKEISTEQKKQYEKDIDAFMKNRKQQLLTNTYAIENNEELFKQLFTELEYRYIYIDKFGIDKFRQIHEFFPKFGAVKAKVNVPTGFLFDHISDAEKEIILSAYKKRELEMKSEITKSQPWIFLLRQFNQATDVKHKMRLLEELKKFMDLKKDKGWIYSKDGIIMLCSHVMEKTEMEAKNMLLNDIRTNLLKYAGDFSLEDAVYCKICGEAITYLEENDGVVLFEGDMPISFHNLEDELKDYIWRITNQTLRSNIQFKTAVSNKYVNMMTTGITMKIYDLVAIIENKLIKAKTNTTEEIENKKSLFTSIYVYAILCKIVLDNFPEITFAKMGNFKPKVENLLEYSLERITLTQNLILNKLPDMNEDFLKTSLDKAFQNIVMLIDKAKLEPPPVIDLIYSIYLDPIFLYSANMKFLMELQDLDKINYNTVEKIWKNTYKTEALFKNFDNSKDKPFLYDDLILPNFSEKLSEKFLKLNKGDGHYIDKDDFIENVYAGYFIESYRSFMLYVQSHVFTEDLYKVNLTVNEKEVTSIQTSLSDHMKQFLKKTQDVRQAEKIYKSICKHFRMLAFQKLPFQQSLQYKYMENLADQKLAIKYGYNVNKKMKLGLDLIDKFHKHNWNMHAYVNINEYIGTDINLYLDKDIKLHIYKTKEIKDIPEEEFYKLKFIDDVCSVCLYAVHNTDEIKNIKLVLDEQQTIDNFYNYYENRCPNAGKESIFHIFKDNECKKCGFINSMYYKKDAKYFYKFNENFEKEIKIQQKIKHITETDKYNDEFTEDKKSNIEQVNKVNDYVKKWKYNTNIINEFIIKTYDVIAKVMPKIKKSEYLNIFNNLGLTEKYIYDDIISGKETPYKEVSDILAKMRINKIKSYIHEIIYNYSILKNHKTVLVLPADIKLLIDGFDAKELSILEKLNDINKIYHEDKHDYFYLDKTMQQEHADNYLKLSEFQLEYIFNLLLHLHEYLEKQNKKLASNIIVYLISKIMISEKVTARIKDAKKTAIEAGQTMPVNITGEDHEDDLGEEPSLKHIPSEFDNDFDYEPDEDHDAKI